MTLNDVERKEILELLANGKISAEAAATLLSQSTRSTTTQVGADSTVDEKSAPVGDATARKASGGPSWFRVQVNDLGTGKSKVKVSIPFGMLRFGLDIGRRFAPELEELDLEQLYSFAGSEDGLLVDVQDEEDGEHVRIFVE